MAEKSKIEWTNATWNPWHGCKKVSPGCKFCYMYRDKERYKKDPTEVIRSKKFKAPLNFGPEHKLVFTCSWSDFFIEEADQWRDEAWEIIKQTPHLTYQILTKRPERIMQCLPDNWKEGYKNVWLGVSAENQETLNLRAPILKSIPARVRFLSLEPLLGSVALQPNLTDGNIHWVIVGGESGNENGKYRYRPSQAVWFMEIVRHCEFEGVPVFVKQLGTHLAKELSLKDRHGREMNEWPSDYIKIREFPSK